MIADELRRQADYFLELEDLEDEIGRKGGSKPHEHDGHDFPGHDDEIEEEKPGADDPEAYLQTTRGQP